MAIEDEIINISDLDKGTELLNTDKLLIETNNGTKLLPFKDFVISIDNINFADRLQPTATTTVGGTTVIGNGLFTSVNGTLATTVASTPFNVLATGTLGSYQTKYQDLSGAVELIKYTYNKLLSISDLTDTNSDLVTKVLNNESGVEAVHNLATTVPLSSTNFKVINSGPTASKQVDADATAGTMGYNGVTFDGWLINPTKTHTRVGGVTFNTSPFSMTYPTAGDPVDFASGWYLFTGVIQAGADQNSQAHFTTGAFQNEDERFWIFKNGKKVSTADYTDASIGKRGADANSHLRGTGAKFNHVEYINPGDRIDLRASRAGITVGSNSHFSGVKLT